MLLQRSFQTFLKAAPLLRKEMVFKPRILFLTTSKIMQTAKPTPQPGRRFFSSFLDKKLKNLRFPFYYYLIGANVLIFLAWNSGVISKKFLFDNFTLSKYTIAKHHYHTLITHAFSHTNAFHLGLNMVTLYFFGKFVELNFGSRVLFQLYFLGALVGGLFITSQNNRKRHVVTHLGASGATTAILSFFIMNFPNYTIFLYFLPVPAWVVGGLIFFQSLYFYESEQGISYSGHMGGFVAGLAMYFHLKGRMF